MIRKQLQVKNKHIKFHCLATKANNKVTAQHLESGSVAVTQLHLTFIKDAKLQMNSFYVEQKDNMVKLFITHQNNPTG